MDNNQILVSINGTKLNFSEIISKDNTISSLLETINETKKALKNEYGAIVKKYNTSEYLFGLDTFNFQTKLVDNEFEHLKSYYNLISNRIYLDYFKVIKLVVQSFKDTTRNNESKNLNYKYDYLDIYKPYKMEEISIIFNHIISILEESHHHLDEESKKQSNYASRLQDGFEINNFITYYNYKNQTNQKNIELYINYLNFFIKLHNKYLDRLYFKLNLMYHQLNHDVKIDKFNAKKHKKELILEQINLFNNEELSKQAYKSTHSQVASKDNSILSHLTQDNISISPINKSLEEEILNSGSINHITSEVVETIPIINVSENNINNGIYLEISESNIENNSSTLEAPEKHKETVDQSEDIIDNNISVQPTEEDNSEIKSIVNNLVDTSINEFIDIHQESDDKKKT